MGRGAIASTVSLVLGLGLTLRGRGVYSGLYLQHLARKRTGGLVNGYKGGLPTGISRPVGQTLLCPAEGKIRSQ